MSDREGRQVAATSLLARMFAGISLTSTNAAGAEEPDFSAGAFEELAEGYGVAAVLELPTGDRYRVSVEWLKQVSP